MRRGADARRLDRRCAGAALTSAARTRGARAARELALLRLVAQGLAGDGLDSPQAAAERLLCLQAQDYWSGLASVAVRCGIGLDQVEAAFDAGSIVRAWPLRGTLHLLAAHDLPWLRELLGPRQLALASLREERLGLDADTLERAAAVALEALGTGPQSRAELNRAWSAAGVDASGQRSYHLIWHLAHRGTLVLGPTRAGRHMFVRCDRWLPEAASIPRHDALARLALRYFSGHGPATPADLTRWANLTAADTRRAVAASRGDLSTLTVDGTEYLLGPTTEDTLAGCRAQAQAVFALPHFDELLLGYRDRNPTLPAERDIDVFANRNGLPARTILYRGQVIATWSRGGRRTGAAVEVQPLVPATGAVLGRATRKAAKIVD
ncbi:MAG: AlkZ family DNA glycosylase [Acidobacteriota bacterium]|nr:AlkZ family DNA glycosylase [Acidobacteriota bacterium]